MKRFWYIYISFVLCENELDNKFDNGFGVFQKCMLLLNAFISGLLCGLGNLLQFPIFSKVLWTRDAHSRSNSKTLPILNALENSIHCVHSHFLLFFECINIDKVSLKYKLFHWKDLVMIWFLFRMHKVLGYMSIQPNWINFNLTKNIQLAKSVF